MLTFYLFLLLQAAHVHGADANPTADRQPQLAVNGDIVAMVYGRGHSIFLRRSTDGGRTFGASTHVADDDALSLGRHRGPRLVFSGKTMVISAVEGPTVEAGNLLVWRSQDGGNTWSKPVVVNDVPGAAREGLHAMTVDARGNLAAVWLDLRAKGTRLYGAFSSDAGATWSKNLLMYESPDGTICQCCDPSIAAEGPGEFAIMWRNAMDGNRDMYFLHVRDGKIASEARKFGNGSWQLSACPMDGGGIAASKGHLVSAWRRDDRVYVADSESAETEIGSGKDVAMAMGKKGVYVAWVASGGVELRKPESTQNVRIAEHGAFPMLAALPDGAVLAAWESDGKIVTQRIE